MQTTTQYYLETCRVDGTVMTISGWMFDAIQPIKSIVANAEAISGRHQDQSIAATGFLRTDVADDHGKQHANSGFVINGLVVPERCRISLGVELDDGAVHTFTVGEYEPWAPFLPGAQYGKHHDARAARERPDSSKAMDLPRNRYFPALPLGGVPMEMFGRSNRKTSIYSSVYKGREYLDQFFEGLRRYTNGYEEIVLVDNGNTDSEIIQLLKSAELSIPRCRVVRVDDNNGYIAGICAAYENRSFDGHAIVLNTDLALPPGWLERLVWPLDHLPQVASATPFTNAGSSCSFPLTAVDNEIFLGCPVEKIDAFFQRVSHQGVTTLPSGVGFCMALHADMLERLGWFDLETYGFGYGEENDWCLTAERMGWRNVLVPNLFVYHKHGGVYPSEEKKRLIQGNMKIVNKRFPQYKSAVQNYFNEDPLAGLRSVIAFQIASEQGGGGETSLSTWREFRASGRSLGSEHSQVLIFEDAASPLWLAVLIAPGWRDYVWGWGQHDLDSMADFLSIGQAARLQFNTASSRLGSGYGRNDVLTVPPVCHSALIERHA